MTPDLQTQWLVDRAQIMDTFHEWLHRVDSKQFVNALDLCTEDCEFVYPSGTLAVAQVRLMAKKVEAEGIFSASQHLAGSHRIEIDGDFARLWAKVQATHIRDPADSDTWYVVGGTYSNEFRRTKDGWRVSRAKLEHDWETGDNGM
jgi:ketosteroid isomerase-like protein